MTYDLKLIPKNMPDFGLGQFRALFEGDFRYAIDGVQANYGNEDTEVYFGFGFCERGKADQVDTGGSAAQNHLQFEINYMRPNCFGLEAVMALEQLHAIAEFEVYDPQFGDGQPKPYSSEVFLRGWQHGNSASLKVMADDEAAYRLTLPQERSDEAWSWNYHSDNLQDRLGGDVFVPKCLLISAGGAVEARIAFLWQTYVPTVVPPMADAIMLADVPEQRRLFGIPVGRKTDGDWRPGLVDRLLFGEDVVINRVGGEPGYAVLLSDPKTRSRNADKLFDRARASAQYAISKCPRDQVLDADLMGEG